MREEGGIRGILSRAACALAATAFAAAGVRAASEGGQVAVIFNSRMPESRELALYYAERRGVPANQVLGFDLPTTETISRADFREQLQRPLLKALERQGLVRVHREIPPTTRDQTGRVIQTIEDAKVRYAVLCYGVPVRVLNDPQLSEPGMEKTRPELRRNDAAVDSELASLKVLLEEAPLYGAIPNPAYGVTNGGGIHPKNGVWIVGRLDGPTVEIARGLVDKAIQAEMNGLWGRAYFDLRGLTNGGYKLGDDWIRGASDAARRLGFETIVDDKGETFAEAFPLSQIAFYAGWYDGQYSGPFTRPVVEFMPGAFAYHLHSFSAGVLRAPDKHWVGPLLAKGATATIGYVQEPYLEGTMNVALFFANFTVFGLSLGEAACAAQQLLSWQTIVVGDPLYRPYGRGPGAEQIGARFRELHGQLLADDNPLIEWSHLQVVNLNLSMGYPVSEMIDYLEGVLATQESSVLFEKLAALNYQQGKYASALRSNERALQLPMSPLQRQRVMLHQAQLLATGAREEQAFDLYDRFLREFPDYPDPLAIYSRMLPLARALKRTADQERIQKEIDRLQPPARTAGGGG